MEIYEEALRLKKQGRSSAVATIVQCMGSSPQKEGAKMLVRDDGTTAGTLGGGCIEAEVREVALMALKDGTPQTIPFSLTEKHGGLVCGGKILVYIEPVIPDPSLIILGAGHVGKALSRVAKFSGFRVTVVDDRAEHANRDVVPDADNLVVCDFGNVFERVPVDKKCFIVVATRGHNHDLGAVQAALKTEAHYVGLLGSKRKKTILFRMLEERGFSKGAVNRVIIPVGLPISSVTPEEIAISIMAQIIQFRRENGASRVGGSSCSRLFEENGEAETASSPR